MLERLRALLPDSDAVRNYRWLQWMGPSLHHPRLWHMSRRGLALGVALGIFFGLLIPVAQIPVSAAAAVVLRANIPGAVASTLVTNPATFGPIYYAAWRVGSALLGEPEPGAAPALTQAIPAAASHEGESWWERALQRVGQVGKPLLLGLTLFAVSLSTLSYLLVSWAWTLRVRHKRRRRGLPAAAIGGRT